MRNNQMEMLHDCISAGIDAAVREMSNQDLRQLVVGPYLELQTELSSSLALAA